MSFCRYSHLVFRNSHLQNSLKVLSYNIPARNGSISSSDTSGSGGDGDSPICSDDNTTTYYDCRKYGHNLPTNNVRPEFDTLRDIPTGVFRSTKDESLGMGETPADGTFYQNPEYFSFHHMTYYDMHWALRRYRKTCPDTGRKK